MNILAIHVLQGQLQSHAGSDLRHVNDSMRRGRLKIIREYRLPAQPERWDVNQRAGLRAEIVFNWSRQGRRPYVQTAHDGALLLASLVDKTGGQHALVHCTQASGGANKYAASFAPGWLWLDLNFMQNNDPANVSEPLLSSPDERMNPRLFPPFVAPPCRHEPLALPQESAGDVGFDRRGQGSEGIVRPAESPCGAVTGSFEGASSCYTSALELSLP